MNLRLLFISTNNMWSGSEELWHRSAVAFKELGYNVRIATKYDDPRLSSLDALRLNYGKVSENIGSRILEKFTSLKKNSSLYRYISEVQPHLAIISQGNNVDSLHVMETCISLKIPFVTLTQLVTEVHLLQLNNCNLQAFQRAYSSAEKNFFVSKKNLLLNNHMMGINLTNAEVVFNPCKLSNAITPEYNFSPDLFEIALVGRIEFFHKGYDLLLQVISQEKWQQRPVCFNFYGNGPHVELLKAAVERHGLNNIKFWGHNDDVKSIWQRCQLLLMPSRMEGQALALIEAMHCNRAAIVTDVGGASELIKEGENGFIAANASAADISDALDRAWDCRLEWKRMGLSAGNTLRKYLPNDPIDFFNKKLLEILN